MREGLRGLTLRGRAFLAAGLTAVVCAVVLGQQPLVRVGVLVLAVPLVSAAVLGRARYRLSLTRRVEPQRLAAGQAARVTLSLTNDGRVPSGVLLLEERLPYVLGTRPRFVVEGMGHGWSREVSYTVRSDVRGRFELGPMAVRVRDPFGMVEMGRAFRGTSALVVTPRVLPLPPIGIDGGEHGAGDDRPRSFAVGSAEDVTVRDYRRGDELRRVHWRSSAKAGELMVRREEQPWQSRVTLLLDDRAASHRGQGIASTLEAAVVAAASIGQHLLRRGFGVRLVTATGEHPASLGALGSASGHAAPLLDALAVIGADPTPTLDTRWLGDGGAGLVVAVLGRLGGDDLPALRRVAARSDLALALALDVDGWSTGRNHGSSRTGAARSGGRGAPGSGGLPGQGTATALAGCGWRATTIGPQDRLADAWTDLGRRGAASRGAPSGAPSGAAATAASGVGEGGA